MTSGFDIDALLTGLANRVAAEVILSSPEKHPAFMLSWARRFQQRRAAEQREVAAR